MSIIRKMQRQKYHKGGMHAGWPWAVSHYYDADGVEQHYGRASDIINMGSSPGGTVSNIDRDNLINKKGKTHMLPIGTDGQPYYMSKMEFNEWKDEQNQLAKEGKRNYLTINNDYKAFNLNDLPEHVYEEYVIDFYLQDYNSRGAYTRSGETGTSYIEFGEDIANRIASGGNVSAGEISMFMFGLFGTKGAKPGGQFTKAQKNFIKKNNKIFKTAGIDLKVGYNAKAHRTHVLNQIKNNPKLAGLQIDKIIKSDQNIIKDTLNKIEKQSFKLPFKKNVQITSHTLGSPIDKRFTGNTIKYTSTNNQGKEITRTATVGSRHFDDAVNRGDIIIGPITDKAGKIIQGPTGSNVKVVQNIKGDNYEISIPNWMGNVNFGAGLKNILKTGTLLEVGFDTFGLVGDDKLMGKGVAGLVGDAIGTRQYPTDVEQSNITTDVDSTTTIPTVTNIFGEEVDTTGDHTINLQQMEMDYKGGGFLHRMMNKKRYPHGGYHSDLEQTRDISGNLLPDSTAGEDYKKEIYNKLVTSSDSTSTDSLAFPFDKHIFSYQGNDSTSVITPIRSEHKAFIDSIWQNMPDSTKYKILQNLNPKQSGGLRNNLKKNFDLGGQRLPGGMMTKIPGSDAVEFTGRKHDQGGILLDAQTEVEGGETMDKVNGKDYFFSSALKYGGVPFSQLHKNIIQTGGDDYDINLLAQMQEYSAGRNPNAIAATGGMRQNKKQRLKILYADGGIKEYKIPTCEGGACSDYDLTPNPSLSDNKHGAIYKLKGIWMVYDSNTERFYALEKSGDILVKHSSLTSPMQFSYNELDQEENRLLDLETKTNKNKNKNKNKKTSTFPALQEGAQNIRQWITDQGGTFPVVADLGAANIEAKQAETETTGLYGAVTTSNLEDFYNRNETLLNEMGIHKWQDFDPVKHTKEFQLKYQTNLENIWDDGNSDFAKRAMEAGYTWDDFKQLGFYGSGATSLESNLFGEFTFSKSAFNLDAFDDDSDEIVVDDKEVKPIEDPRRPTDYTALALGLANIFPAIQAYKDQPDYMAPPELVSPGVIIPEEQAEMHLNRYNFNLARQKNQHDYQAMSNFIKTSGMGPAGIVNQMALYTKKLAGDAAITDQEVKVNKQVQDQEASINKQIEQSNISNQMRASEFNIKNQQAADAANIQSRMHVDEFNRAADAATKDRQLMASTYALQSLQQMYKDKLQYDAQHELAKAYDMGTGTYLRYLLQNDPNTKNHPLFKSVDIKT